jgi:hypothetical protein
LAPTILIVENARKTAMPGSLARRPSMSAFIRRHSTPQEDFLLLSRTREGHRDFPKTEERRRVSGGQDEPDARFDPDLKRLYTPGSHKYNTRALGNRCGVMQGDLWTFHAGRLNGFEFKLRSPFCTRTQLVAALTFGLHIIVHPVQRDTPDGIEIWSPQYEVFCPARDREYGIEHRLRGYLLSGNGASLTVPHDDLLDTFRSHKPFPCCGRFSSDWSKEGAG